MITYMIEGVLGMKTPQEERKLLMSMMIIMQRNTCKTCKLAPLALHLKKQLIELNLNSFDELLPYNKPGVKKFVRISGCSSFALSAREVF